MTAPAPGLPEDVERALTEAITRAASIGYDGAPDDKYFGGEALDVALDRAMDSDKVTALRAAILAAMRAATAGSGAASAASAGSAAHVAPPVSASFEEALAALDVEPTHHTDKMITTHIILGLDDVRAAHRAEVDRLAARLAEEIKWGHARCTPEVCQSSGVDCPAAIRARGAKS